jgi:hypothetical protein
MKPRSLRSALFFLIVCAAIVIMTIGCHNPLTSGVYPETPTGTITGKVLSLGMTDNSGINVTAELTEGMNTFSVQNMLSGGSAATKAVAAQAVTDANGTYFLTDLQPGTYTVTASSADSLERAVTTSVTVTAGSLVEVVVMKLTRTGAIAGTATLADASNHLGIVVYVAGTSFSAMTDAAGNFTISWVPAGTGYTLVASMDGYDSAITNVNVTVGNTTTVQPPLSLPRHVISPTAGIIAGNATLDGSGSLGIVVYVAGTFFSAMTDAMGNFTIGDVPPETNYTLVANFIGYDSAIVSDVMVEAGKITGPISLKLVTHVTPPTTGSISGTAKLSDAAPDSNGGIFVYLEGTSYICVTDHQGNFLLAGVVPSSPGSEYKVTASKPGYYSISAQASVRAGEVTPIPAEFILAPVPIPTPPSTFLITYYANGADGGTVPSDTTRYPQGQTVIVLGNPGALTRGGYALAGWNTQLNGEGVTYLAGQTFAMGSADIDLYAMWTECTPGLAFALIGQAYSVSKGTFYEGTVIIPAFWNALPVTSIEENAFASLNGLTGITIPISVTSIGTRAFYECTFITSIAIPSSVTNIGSEAFRTCFRLMSVNIPNSITSIGDRVFHGCTALTSVTIPSSITSIGYEAFSWCTGLTSVTIPSSVANIGDFAFYNCTGLSSVAIQDGVTSVPDGAFYNCTGLTTATIPSSVTSIGDEAFFHCISLTSVTIPSSVTSIGDGTFSDCSDLAAVFVLAQNPPTAAPQMFQNCSSLSGIYIPAGTLVAYLGTQGWDTYATLIKEAP